MSREKFILVSLQEERAKDIADVLSNPTGRKILDHLSEHEGSTESTISQSLSIPISTVHYHLQRLQKSGLVHSEEFRYSKKGREIKLYKLVNKYIVIAPGKVEGLKSALRGILPAAFAIAGVSAVLEVLRLFTQPVQTVIERRIVSGILPDGEVAEAVQAEVVEEIATNASTVVAQSKEIITVLQETVPHSGLWFLIGGLSALLAYVLYTLVKNRKQRA